MGNRLKRCVEPSEEYDATLAATKWNAFHGKQADKGQAELGRKLEQSIGLCKNCLADVAIMENRVEDVWAALRQHLRAISRHESLHDIPEKRIVWHFLLQVGTRRRTRRSQVKEIGDVLHQSSTWASVLKRDPELWHGLYTNELLSTQPPRISWRSLLPCQRSVPEVLGDAALSVATGGAGIGIVGSPSAAARPTTNASILPDRSEAFGRPLREDAPAKVPSTWETTSGTQILPDPGLIPHVQRLMTDTWRAKYTRDRKLVDGSNDVPSGCRVESVMRVENHRSYAKYCAHKRMVEARLARGDRFSAITGESLGVSGESLGKLDQHVNEIYAFHGTNPTSASEIAKDGFNMKKAGSNRGSMFGPGIYFAENSSKSDEYAKELLVKDLRAVLVCRVVAGSVLTVTEPGDYSRRVRDENYDSLCGDRRAAAGTFREIVLFQEDGVYIEYIALYRRSYD